LGQDFAYTKRVPLGVCVGIGAWNYPTQIACWKGAPALACGNAMIFKPSETTPLCALKVAEILVEAGAPKGLYNVVQGKGQVGASVSQVQRQKVQGYIEAGKAEGARCITGGNTPDRKGFYLEPTVFADVTDTMTIAREEIFGPVMAVLDFEDEEEVITRANDTEFGLSAGVFTSDLTRAHRVVDQLQAGTCWINTYNLAPVEMPFGGTKMSGVGRENSRAAIEHYTEIKSVYVGMGPVDSPY